MSTAHRGLSWDENERRGKSTALFVSLALVLSLLATGFAPVPAVASGDVDVIVQETNPVSTAAETLVERLGGTVRDHIALIGGFTATIPASTLDLLAADSSVSAAIPDSTVNLLSTKFGETSYAAAFDGSMQHVLRSLGVESFWGSGYTGAGVGVALIDSGVIPVEGLTSANSNSAQVVNGPDLSFESQSSTYRYLDTYGHGTHMAGIIAGRDSMSSANPKVVDDRYFTGVAPNARILNVKVAAYDGAVDVSQVIAAIDWVVRHRNDNGLNIRVLNLSFGTNSSQSYTIDPLAFAVEQAWKAGIVVVVAAGNDGNGTPLRDPASDPFVIAVGASDTKGTLTQTDDVVAGFSNCTSKGRTVDLLAPGVSIVSLRNPGSYADTNYPQAAVGDRFFKGTGTSQSTAVVSGAAALVLSKYPSASPDQVKALLKNTATGYSVKGPLAACYGSGQLNLTAAAGSNLPKIGRTSDQTWAQSTGTGSLEASRGTDHLEQNGVVLSGEKDIFGKAFNSATWAPLAAQGTSWSGGVWNGTSWSGTSWSGTSWSGTSWSGTSWSGTSWSGTSWSGTSWSGTSWTGGSWG